MLEAGFDMARGTITLPRYPFPVRRTRALDRADIVEGIDWVGPALLMTSGEVLCLRYGDREKLQAFCAAHSVPFSKRYDVWSDLLEPFLDTVYADDWQIATHKALQRAGFPDTEIVAIRARIAKRMDWLTSMSWEWQHYGLYDVLSAMKYPLPFMRWGWRAFYSDAMEIARRGMQSDR